MTTYRQAEAADAPVLRAFLQAVSDHDGGPQVGPVEALLRHGFGPRPLFRAMLAEQDGKAVGMVLFFPDFSTHRGAPGTYVQDLFVADAARGAGVGRALLAQAQALGAADWQSCYLTLGVDPGNERARRLYHGLGFRPRGYEFLILDGAGLAALAER